MVKGKIQKYIYSQVQMHYGWSLFKPASALVLLQKTQLTVWVDIFHVVCGVKLHLWG